MRNFFYLFIAVTFLTISGAFAQDNSLKYSATITEADLRSHLAIIASDSFEGRGTAEKGQKLAASYIANQFKNYGLQPVIEKADTLTYFQSFPVYKKSWDNPYLKVGKNEKKYLQDFFSLGNPGFKDEEEMEIVFGGYGEDEIINQKGFDCKGKGVVLLLGKIDEIDSASYARRAINLILTSNYTKKYKTLLDRGAKALFIITGKSDSLFNFFINTYKCNLDEPEISMTPKNSPIYNVFFIPPSTGSEILSLSIEKLRAQHNKQFGVTKEDLKEIQSKKIKIRAFQKVELLETENVLGYIEGTDKKDEVVVITAHYDHEGIKCGQIYNGADDDGTGTATIIEIAQAFSLARKEGNGPRRSILLMTVTGEEKGLLGSKYYTEHPAFPLSQTIVDLNIDMIGRIDKFHSDENYVYLIGSNRLSKKLHQISEEMNFKYTGLFLDYKYNALNDPDQFYYRSDHYNFAKNNIPVIFYFSGTHQDYHKPTDDIEKILFSKVEKTARLVFHTAWELANREERITVDVSK